MAELKGLLDSAKRKIGGLLGDFPAGFNSGAVAGIAGYPGDIAYLLDTAGRAITGQDTQPAAQDFPGTTDYIAAKAGYPIPGSFSGQLGAAVGGLMTPGPGDLAKFAPVLSAIPGYYRATRSADSPMAGAPYAMFAEGDPERIRSYGDNIWEASGDGAVNVADIQKDIVKALRRSGVMRYEHGTAAQLAREANPENIVNSAGLWDRPDLVNVVYRDVLEPQGISAVKTADGLLMFDDKGIKLLERNGSPIEEFAARRAGKAKPYKELAMDEASRMQRAQEMGFDVDNPVYHGTRTKGDAIDAFDLEKAGSKTDAGYMGKGIYFGDDKTANVYAGHYEFDPGHFPEGGAVYPSYLALKSPLRIEDKIENGRSVDLELLARDALGLPRDATAEQVTQEALRQGYDGAIYSRGAGKYQEYVVYQPEKIRSKFAAFDPAKKDSSNLLAGAAATALGLGLAKQQLSEQERRNGM